MDLNGLKHENLSFELQSVANVEDGFRKTLGPSVVPQLRPHQGSQGGTLQEVP
ncbi:hypothetical protein PCANC_15268 [Puccinia coronata f. sp. avenae]|uniref:Uncharacterized protein n=1 Tax=Puccinia coronata f. sp. avenae TaxID=200324 RepID=A0A2N5UIH1_9BASI|nr:hypothetical protein PCANC_15268 [Puccinia coronata f. sp. avenae]